MKTKYELFCRETGKSVSVYRQFGGEQELFDSVDEARKSNCHGVYEDRVKYGVRRVKILVSGVNCDPPTKTEEVAAKKKAKAQASLEKEMDVLGLKGMDRLSYGMSKAFSSVFIESIKKGPFGEMLTAKSGDSQ